MGTAGATGYGSDLAWVCMVLVDPRQRGQGLGTRLVSEVLERLAGFAAVGLDATPQGRPVYAGLGFVAGPELLRLERPPGPAPGPEPAGGRARPLAPSDLEAVLAWDREVFGADRGRVLRGARERAPEYAWCVDGADGLIGYCFGRRGGNAEQVGPVVARDVAAARALVAAVLARAGNRPFFLDAASFVPGWVPEVERLGFRPQRPFTRMYRGTPPPAPAALHAVFGPEFG